MIFSERNKIVNVNPAIDANAATIASDIVSMKNYDHATFIITFGVVNASSATTTNLIASKGEDVTTCATAFACKYRAEVTSGGDTLEAIVTLPTTGVSLGTGNTLDVTGDNAIVVVEIDADDLAPTAANPYDTVKVGMVWNAQSVLMSIICVLSKPRFADAAGPTAITD